MISNPDFEVMSKPTPTTLGAGIKTTSVVVRASNTMNFGLHSCPYNGRCVGLFTSPDYWNGAAYSIGSPEQVRLYLVTFHQNIPTFLPTATDTHTLVIGLYADKGTRDLKHLTKEAQPILNSLRLPETT